MKGSSNKIATLLIRSLIVECIVLVIVVIAYAGTLVRDKETLNREEHSMGSTQEEELPPSNGPIVEQLEEDDTTLKENASVLEEEKNNRKVIESYLEQARMLALGYDYDAAIKLLTSYEGYETISPMVEAVQSYETTKSQLSLYGAYESADQISHVFFHSLIVDTDLAFDGDRMSNGYNYWMTTVDEFNEMMYRMYEAGYVLVRMRDIIKEEVRDDGTVRMVAGDLMLPADKKPFVLSQDDVNYYEYMQTDGFARKIVIDEQGYPACEMEQNGQIVVARDFDVVPLLEQFIEEHPDFSYRGARGIIGVTGYEGVMGYRTNLTKADNYAAEVRQATKVADRLKELGWEFASHSYGHGHLGKESSTYVKRDSDRWNDMVAPIVGTTDLYLFPYGEDIQQGVGTYSGEKYNTLYNLGFRYFCGVYAYPWMQVTNRYVRMTRRNLDGYTMNYYPSRLMDLFNVDAVIDLKRPIFYE